MQKETFCVKSAQLEPISACDAPQEEQPPHGQLNGHGHPYAPKSEVRRHGSGKRQTHKPHRAEVDEGRLQRVARPHADAVGHDGGSEERLNEGLYAKHLRAQGTDFGHRREQTNHLWGEDIHHRAHQCHDRHARNDGHLGKGTAEVGTPRAHTLPDKGGGRVADAVAGHVAEALRRDGKGVGGNGEIAQWRDNRGGNDLRTVHQQILEGHGGTQTAGMADVVPVPYKPLLVLPPCQYLASEHGKVEQWHRRSDESHERAQRRTLHTEAQSPDGEVAAEEGNGAGGEDKEKVEEHVEDAHEHRNGTGATHIAAHLQHRGGEVLDQMAGDGKGEDEKIHCRIVLNVGSAAQPTGQREGNQCGDDHQQETDEKAKGIAMAHDGTGTGEIIGSDKVGSLHAESHGGGTNQRPKQPRGRLDKTDGGRGRRTEAAHHRCVDVEHQHRGDLGEDGGYAQLDDEVHLLTARKRVAGTELGQQRVRDLLGKPCPRHLVAVPVNGRPPPYGGRKSGRNRRGWMRSTAPVSHSPA